ncbi:MAG: GNAT family N-acetyltransferase [Crocinitomicaceae bacterium]|nr:GNAT family N-acetyltransferase [Crocinitomicaceae bacterium]
MKRVEIKEIKKTDNEIIARVIRDVLTEHGVNKPGTVFTDPTTDHLFELFEKDKSFYYIVWLNEQIVGGCGVFPTKGLAEGCAELVKLYVLKKARGLGLGKELMERCAENAKKLGYQKLYLETLPELSNAVKLYESLGYERLDEPLGDSGHFACNLWMLKEL